MREKFQFYQTYGVEEYYLYDPDTFVLRGWLRQRGRLVSISSLKNWISPRLGIRFGYLPGQELELYYPDGRKFLTSVELDEQLEQQRQRAEQQQQRAEQVEAQLHSVALNLLRQGMSSQQVADLVGLSMAQIEEMQPSAFRNPESV